MVNPSYPNNTMPSTQSWHGPYLGTIDSMPLVPNPMTPMMNPRMTKVMMTSDNTNTLQEKRLSLTVFDCHGKGYMSL